MGNLKWRKRKKVWVILISICLILALYGYIDQSIKNSKPYFSVTTEETLEKIILEDNCIIIDVRTKEEYDEGHIVGAIHIPYDKIEETIGTYVGLDEKDIMVYSGDGNESSAACSTLRELGYGCHDLGAYDTITLEKDKGAR